MLHEHVPAPGLGGGGAESLLRDQTEALRRRGHEIAWLQACRFEDTIELAVNQFQPDVVHIGTIHNFIGPQPAQWLLAHNVPAVWAIMDYWPWCQSRMLLKDGDQSCSAVASVCDNDCATHRRDPSLLELVNQFHVVALNRFTADIYRRNGLRADSIVELGVDTALFSPGEKAAASNVNIVTCNAWGSPPTKGLHVIRKAIEGTSINVGIITGMAREKVAEALKCADIFIAPSCYQETWGLTATEAMASGCAVIASDVAGYRAQIEPGVTGLLFENRNYIELRDAITTLMSAHGLRRALGRRAREHVLEDHTLDKMAERWEGVYQAAMGK